MGMDIRYFWLPPYPVFFLLFVFFFFCCSAAAGGRKGTTIIATNLMCKHPLQNACSRASMSTDCAIRLYDSSSDATHAGMEFLDWAFLNNRSKCFSLSLSLSLSLSRVLVVS